MQVRLLRRLAGLTAVLLAAGLWQAATLAQRLQVSSASASWTALFAAWTAALVMLLAATWVSYRPSGARLADRLANAYVRIRLPGPASLLLFSACCLLLPGLVLAPLPVSLALLLELFALRAVAFWLLVLAGAACLKLRQPGISFGRHLAVAALVSGAVYRAAMFLPDISTYPFSLGWSEGSRYYYASLFLARQVYGTAASPSVLHPTRYLMQAVPFLIDGLPLWFHRFWQVFLWLGTNALAAWLLARRLGVSAGGRRGLLALWGFLFLFQAPVWYHLVVMIIIVLWGVDSARFWRTLAVVAVASIWAGMSRVNWIPFPAALAALLYLLEIPRQGKPFLRYLWPPIAWGLVGTALGLASQAVYALLSGNALDQFGSSFSSDLLWYRLFPSATYPLGVVPAIVLATLPVFWVVTRRLGRRWQALEPLRILGILGLLLVFFSGGLVVSAKIGGGSNLHNMDGYIALLLVFGAYVYAGIPGLPGQARDFPLTLAISVPVAFALLAGGTIVQYDPAEVSEDLADLAGLVEKVSAQGGEVLFISQRHLLAVDEIQGVGLVEDYEKVFLMEMAMAGNRDYLGRFENDLAEGRFTLIISDIVRYNPQTRDDPFGEENNAWDAFVSAPILCYYEALQTFPGSRMQVLTPKEWPDPCEPPGAP